MSKIRINLEEYEVKMQPAKPLKIRPVLADGAVPFECGNSFGHFFSARTREGVWIYFKGHTYFVEPVKKAAAQGSGTDGDQSHSGEIISPMPGKIFRLLVKDGQSVKKGEDILILEAMKMEHALQATRDGKVKLENLQEGQLVQVGNKLASIIAD